MAVVELNPNERVPFVLEDDQYWLDFDKKDEFLPLVNPINYEFEVSQDSTTVKARPISCYKDGYILKVEDENWKEDWAQFYYLYCDGNYFQLGGINDTLWSINEAVTLNLKKYTVLNYIKLVSYFYLVDEYGSRFLLEDDNSEFIDFLAAFPFSNALERARCKDKLKPPVINGPDQNGVFDVECDILVDFAVVRSRYSISQSDGSIDSEVEYIVLGELSELSEDTEHDDDDSSI